MSPRRHLFLLSISTSAVLVAATAQAQQSEAATTLGAVLVVPERAVTATKTDTPLVEIPQAISAVTSELYTERGARNMQETLRYSAGVTAEAYGLDTRADTITVRGLTPVQYQDGMRKLYNFSPLPRAEIFSLDRVEVLRGPSSVLYGQGASGGIINSVSKRPEFESAGEIGLQFGSFDRKQLQADITGPLDDDGVLAGRLIGVFRDSGMQTDKLDDDRVFLSPSLTWRPGADTELTFIGVYQRDRTGSSQQFLPVGATLNAPSGRELDPSTFLGDENHDRLDARQTSATILASHYLSDALTLRANLRYVDAETTFQEIYPDVYSNPSDPFIDADDRVLSRVAYGTKPDMQIFTSDTSLQYDFATGALRHRLLSGVDYTSFRQSSLSAFGAVTPIDAYDPVSTGVVFPAYGRDPDQRNTQVGLYLQDQVSYGERLSMVLGVRRDRARSRAEGSRSQTDEATTFKIGVIGEIAPGVSPYVSYSESFLPVAGVDRFDNALVPVRGRQIEAGVKWAPVRGALVTANVYRITESNRPTNDPAAVLEVVQTGEIQSRGFELEAAFAVSYDFTVTASYSYNDAEVTESNYAWEVDTRLSDTPRHLASLWGAKSFPVGDDAFLRVGLGGRYVGETVSTGATSSLRTPSYTLADAMVALDWADWSLAVNATNLFDKEYYAPCRVFGDCFTGNSRTVVGTLSYLF